MQIMIDIPEEIYNSACATNNIWDMRMAGFVCSAIANGTLLPKGHGRLIDADAFKKNVCTYQQTGCGDCKHSLCCPEDEPTIIEADKAESEVQDAT